MRSAVPVFAAEFTHNVGAESVEPESDAQPLQDEVAGVWHVPEQML
jgi:hypothetical protein